MWDDWRRTDEMNGCGQLPAWKFETGNRQLQIGIGKRYHGVK